MFSGMPKGHLETVCETDFHMPDFTIACLRESLPVRIQFYFNSSGVSFTSSGLIS